MRKVFTLLRANPVSAIVVLGWLAFMLWALADTIARGQLAAAFAN